MAKQAVIKGVTIQEGDIVRIKFRPLEKLLADERKYCSIRETLEFYGITDHMSTFCRGFGHFIVKECVIDEDDIRLSETGGGNPLSKRSRKHQNTPQALPEIKIEDHNNSHMNWWTLNELLIDEISVENEVAESHFSEEHDLSLVIIDSTLYINGKPVAPTDTKIWQMFEKVMAETAINNIVNQQD